MVAKFPDVPVPVIGIVQATPSSDTVELSIGPPTERVLCRSPLKASHVSEPADEELGSEEVGCVVLSDDGGGVDSVVDPDSADDDEPPPHPATRTAAPSAASGTRYPRRARLGKLSPRVVARPFVRTLSSILGFDSQNTREIVTRYRYETSLVKRRISHAITSRAGIAGNVVEVTRSPSSGASTTRDIARTAIQAELAQAAFRLFLRQGFEGLTINDFAEAGGVSRSTFLRYFGTKEDALLWVLDSRGRHLAEALSARPADENDWTAFQRAFEVVFGPDLAEPDRAGLRRTQLIKETPILAARQSEKQQTYWLPALARALAHRAGRSGEPSVADEVHAAAGVGCMNVAVNRWTTSDGQIGLLDALEEAFAALRLQ